MDIAPLFGVTITTPSPPPPSILVFWSTPPVGSYKINTDGCVKDGFASGGGIIRDSDLGKSVLWVESDSTLAIHCITKGGGPWHIQATLWHIRHLLALDRDTITHIFREGNQVADLLALEGWDRCCYYEYSSQDLPRRTSQFGPD
ncbi:Ribonuclease H protein [Abeliophyllum distichum]|uniref:Ribonuclease H protein n=1 Tax=Abeliophyllum distichum TaxID=126358 RepID=A0ABD1PB67_9LAMI